MSVWLCIPSKRPPEQVAPLLAKWRAQGYKIALYTDMLTPGVTPSPYIVNGLADLVLENFTAEYPGYSAATNSLIEAAIKRDEAAEWFVIGGDDVEPDAAHPAQQIADQCVSHFHNTTYGVMQPTGDRWGDGRGAYIDRVCGSAWIGREFAQVVYGGKGPLWPEYTHMFADEELQAVAQKLGVLWQRRDLIQLHRHWARERGQASDMPEFLRKANQEFGKYRTVFEQRKAAGFPGI